MVITFIITISISGLTRIQVNKKLELVFISLLRYKICYTSEPHLVKVNAASCFTPLLIFKFIAVFLGKIL